MTRHLCFAPLVLLGACASSSSDGTERPPAGEPTPAPSPVAPSPAPAPPEPPPAPAAADEAAAALPAEICAGLRAAPALALAVVRAATPDCSGVGHTRIVFDVVELARGTGIAVVSHSHLLYTKDGPRFAGGDHAVLAIEPAALPAEEEMCVPLPKRDGRVTRAVRVDSAAAGARLLERLSGGGC